MPTSPSSKRLQVALHVGAHKTATSHLQRSLQTAREALLAAGIAYFGPHQLRHDGERLMGRFSLRHDDQTRQSRKSLEAMSQGAGRLVISEENYIGTLQNSPGQMAFPLYPEAAERISALARQAAPDGLDVFLGIRQPSSFLTSTYGQMLMGGGTTSLAEYKRNNPVDRVNWPDLVARIRAAEGVRELIVWRHEDYPRLFSRITAAMCGKPVEVAPFDDIVHRGLSQEAVTALHKGRVTDALAARDAYPAGPTRPAFQAYGRWVQLRTELAYRAQLRQIASMPGVTLLRP